MQTNRMSLPFLVGLMGNREWGGTVDLSFYTNYDNRPPTATAATNDYGVITYLGYSF